MKKELVSMEEKRAGTAGRKRKLACDSDMSVSEVLQAGATGRADEEKEKEQMERFYALLENIKSMRYAWAGPGGTSEKKMKVDKDTEKTQADHREVPWKPTFRLEDFDFMQGHDDDDHKSQPQRRINKDKDDASASERSDI